MFSGIVEAVGTVREVAELESGRRLRIAAPFAAELREGDSVAVDGACLTATAALEGTFEVDVIATTLSRTTLGRLRAGSLVNLERALALGARVNGHLVQGHVDAVGEVLGVAREGEHVLLDVRLPEVVAEVTVPRGSIAVAGVSLTVGALPEPDRARVSLIPYTWSHTTLRDLQPGDGVNLEGDMLGRFVVSYMKKQGPREGG